MKEPHRLSATDFDITTHSTEVCACSGEFTKFRLLPPELRSEIWKCTFPAPRKLALASASMVEREDGEQEWIPVALLVHRESRWLAQIYYHKFDNEYFSVPWTFRTTREGPVWLRAGHDALSLSFGEVTAQPAKVLIFFEFRLGVQVPGFLEKLQVLEFTGVEFLKGNKTMFDGDGGAFQWILLQCKSLRVLRLIEVHPAVYLANNVHVSKARPWWEDQAVGFFKRHAANFRHGVVEVVMLRYMDVPRTAFQALLYAVWWEEYWYGFSDWEKFWSATGDR